VLGLDGVSNNMVCCVKYRDPKYDAGFIFPAKRLKGAIDPPRVLKPGDLDAEASRNWRPIIGMVPSTTRATLGDAGHRMVGHHAPKSEQRPYSFVPPPANLDRRNNYHNRGNNYGRYSNHSIGPIGFEHFGGQFESVLDNIRFVLVRREWCSTRSCVFKMRVTGSN
jgi:hypothetical protein